MPHRIRTATTTMAALAALSALALSGCTAATGPAAGEQSPSSSRAPAEVEPEPTPDAAPTPESTEPTTCTNFADLVSYDDDWSVEFSRELEDLGAREFADGEVGRDDEGTIVTYTVAPGDVEAVIGERLCVGSSLASMNHVRTIQPGQVLWLDPDPDTPWVSYGGPVGPNDPPGTGDQLSYQRAIEAAGAAVDAGDVDTARAIWNDTLSGMFTNQDTVDAIQRVVDEGDPDALRQLFS